MFALDSFLRVVQLKINQLYFIYCSLSYVNFCTLYSSARGLPGVTGDPPPCIFRARMVATITAAFCRVQKWIKFSKKIKINFSNHTVRSEIWVATFYIKKFLHSDICSETGFSYNYSFRTNKFQSNSISQYRRISLKLSCLFNPDMLHWFNKRRYDF